MRIPSTRFAALEVDEDAVLTFSEGLIGLPGTTYTLVAHGEGSPFHWLHSLEHPEVAVPVTSPWIFFGDYEVRLTDDEAASMGLSEAGQAEVMCVVRAAPELADFTINLAGPIIVHSATRLCRQLVKDRAGYSVRHPLFSEVELSEAGPAVPAVPVAAVTTPRTRPCS
jgi:flagellar assembly factor FliW